MEGKPNRYLPLQGTGGRNCLLTFNAHEFARKVPASAKLKGTTADSSPEGKSTPVLRAPGRHDARTASNAALTLVFVFPIALGSHPSLSSLSDCESHCKQGLFDTQINALEKEGFTPEAL